MSEQQDKILSSRLIVWLTILIIPTVGLVLSVYEIFFQNDGPKRGGPHPRAGAEKMYAEAKVEETKGEILSAYAKYSSIYDLYPQSSAGKKSKENLQDIQASTKEKITKLAAEKDWRELKKMENIVAQILPDEVEWLENQIKYKGKTPPQNSDKPTKPSNNNKQATKTWAKLEKEIQPLLKKNKYEKATRMMEKNNKLIVENDLAIFNEKKAELYYLGGKLQLEKSKNPKAKQRALKALQKAIDVNPEGPFAAKAKALLDQQKGK